jgi:UDP-glucose 4-epimerase
VAKVDRIRSLGWSPQHDNLDEVVDQALRWERDLAGRKAA